MRSADFDNIEPITAGFGRWQERVDRMERQRLSSAPEPSTHYRPRIFLDCWGLFGMYSLYDVAQTWLWCVEPISKGFDLGFREPAERPQCFL